MKKLLFFAAAASVALVACTKNEVAQIDNEITYQTVQTRAASAFSELNKFISYAYFLPQGKTWDANYGTASPYISEAEISFHYGNMWKASKTYYWPKQGSLTFFAWSTNTATPAITGGTVTCPLAKGISVDTYDLTQNRNVDFLVAEVAKDQTENTTKLGEWQKGVPTVFKHALSSIAFKVQTVVSKNDPTEKDYSSDNVTFKVKSIELLGVSNKASYAQTWNAAAAASSHVWNSKTTGNIPAFTGTQVVTKTATDLTITPGTDYSIVLPQTIDSAKKIKIVYDITTEFISGHPVTETVTETKDFNTVYTDGWKPGKKYTVTIKLSMDEILWAPDVTDWEVVSATDINI